MRTAEKKSPAFTPVPAPTIRIVVADDHPVVRFGVKNMLLSEPGFDVVGWYGLAAPAGTPQAAIARLNSDANGVLKSADLIAQFRLQGYEPVGGTPQEATAWIKAEVTRWTNVIREAGIESL